MGSMRNMVSMKKVYINGHYEFVEDLADALSWVEALGGYDLREYIEESMDDAVQDAIQDEVEKRMNGVAACLEEAQDAILAAIDKM